MTLGTLRTRVTGMGANLDAALLAISATDLGTLRAQYGQFAATYGGVTRELAELYPIRGPRLLAQRLDGDAAILLPASPNIANAAPPVAALRPGVAGLPSSLNTRLQQAS